MRPPATDSSGGSVRRTHPVVWLSQDALDGWRKDWWQSSCASHGLHPRCCVTGAAIVAWCLMAVLVTRSRLCELLQDVLRTEADFGAFVLDHFPSVHVCLVGGMDRLSRTNLLRECADVDDLVRLLIASHPAVATRIGAAEPTTSQDHSGLASAIVVGSTTTLASRGRR